LALKYVDQKPRIAKQDAKNAVRDPLDALIELITNSMDSYNRMKARKEKIPQQYSDKIEVYLMKKTKKEKKAIVGVKDWAEGISPDKMLEYISGYGARTSGKNIFQSIRGYFGRGLKDAVGGLDGKGHIYSVKNGIISYGFIDGTSKMGIQYEENIKTYDANTKTLKKHHLDDDGKTIALIEFSTENIQVPNFDSFSEKLTLCVQLRPIMEKGNIKLIQIRGGKIIKEGIMKFNPPKAEQVLLETDNKIPGEFAKYDIEINKAYEPLLSQHEAGKFRVGGLQIMSGISVHEATLGNYDRDPNASKFFGKVRCDYIDELMRKDEAVVTPDRQGLNWDHPFLKKLKKEIDKKLKIHVDKERKDRDKRMKGVSEDTLKRNEKIAKKLGKLYKEIIKEETGELADLGGSEISDGKEMLRPSGGFAFIPPYYSMEHKKPQQIRLVIDSPKIIPSYAVIKLISTNKELILEKNEFQVSQGQYIDTKGLFLHLINVIGKKVGEEGEIIAETKDKNGNIRRAKARIFVKEMEGYPPDGFSFVPNEYKCKIEKPTKLILKIDGDLIEEDNWNISIESNNKYIIIDEPSFIISKNTGIIEKNVIIKGNRVGESGIITAIHTNNPTRKAEALVKVVATTPTSSPKGIYPKFDNAPHPIQRAVCVGNIIYIYVNEPTVKRYYGDGELTDALSFQVLCADLITESFCTKIVDDLAGTTHPLLKDDEDAKRSKLNELKMKYGPIVHQIYVSKTLLEEDWKRIRGA